MTSNQPVWMAPPSPRVQHRINKWAARIIPAILIGIVVFATWVVIVLIAVQYLLHPPVSVQPRHGAGVAIIAIYCVLLLLMSVTYFRVLQVVATNPGLVPSPHLEEQKRSGRNKSHGSDTLEKRSFEYSHPHQGSTGTQADYLDRGAIFSGRQSAPNGLEQYYNRDIFECELDGMPRWCSTCKIWKPDRSHHSSEIGRCVYKMDHFCPWAGGIVSETTYKFFIQFCFYGMLYCTFTLVVSAYYTAQRHRTDKLYQVTWIIVIALAGLFWIFTFGMSYNTLTSVFQNTTTVDAYTRQNRIYHFAILMPDWHPYVQLEHARRALTNPAVSSLPADAAVPYATITFPILDPSLQQRAQPPHKPRVFAVLPSPQGSNPYLLTSVPANWKEVMGTHWYDWITPLRHSPCKKHLTQSAVTGDRERAEDTPSSMYPFGPIIENMKREAGLLPTIEKSLETDRHGRRRIRERTTSVHFHSVQDV